MTKKPFSKNSYLNLQYENLCIEELIVFCITWYNRNLTENHDAHYKNHKRATAPSPVLPDTSFAFYVHLLLARVGDTRLAEKVHSRSMHFCLHSRDRN